jgi:hypothetical protein
MALALLTGATLDTLARAYLFRWIGQAAIAARAVAELSYLALLFLLAARALPGDASLRSRVARGTTLFVLPLLLGAFWAAQRLAGPREFALVLYHAQRVHLWLDVWPLAYAGPLGLALACALGGALSTDPMRRQTAAAIVLIAASGHAPQSLGRVVAAALGLVVCARAIVSARRWPPAPSGGIERGDRARDASARAIDDAGRHGVAEP